MRIPRLLVLLPLSAPALAQDHTLSTWGAVGAELALEEDTSVGVVQEFRHGQSEGQVEKLTTAVELGHDVGPRLELATHYRVDVLDWDEARRTLGHRMGFDASLPAQVGRVKLSLRQRLQPELKPSEADPFQLVLRTRAKAALALEGWSPYVSVEPYIVADDAEVDRLRGDLGVAFPLGSTKVDLSYRIDEPVAGALEDPHRHILTLRLIWKPEVVARPAAELVAANEAEAGTGAVSSSETVEE